MKYHFTSIRMATIKKNTVTSVGEGEGDLKPSYVAKGNIKWCSHFGKQFGSSSKR